MYFLFKEVVIGIIYIFAVSYGYPVKGFIGAVMYLHNYGYLQESDCDITPNLQKPDMETISQVEDTDYRRALRDFQNFFRLVGTGMLDKQTLLMMNEPRCGVKDIIGNSKPIPVRRKRYALQGNKWKVQLTYRIAKYPSSIKDKATVDSEIARAIEVWSNFTTIHLKEKAKGPVDINIRFEKKEHLDGHPFNSPGYVLAHSSFPNYGGYIHFDDDENWAVNSSTGINLFQIAAHQIGHALGLAHSDDKRAIMYPIYRGYDPDFKVHSDDIAGMQAIYGSPDVLVKPVIEDDDVEEEEKDLRTCNNPITKLPACDGPNLCENATFDTIMRVKNGITYIFKGDFYWKYLCNDIPYGYPRKISEDWDGLEGNLDASFSLPDDTRFFFKGNRYWRFTNKKMDKGYPKLIGQEGFVGIPPNLDAALLWNGNQHIYFFKGDKYWRYDFKSDPQVSKEYPQSIKLWNGLPLDGINGAVRWDNKISYFFKGDKYYRFDDVLSKVPDGWDPPFPRSNADWWFNC